MQKKLAGTLAVAACLTAALPSFNAKAEAVCPPSTGVTTNTQTFNPQSQNVSAAGLYSTIADYRLGRVCQVVFGVNSSALSCEDMSQLSPDTVSFLRNRDCPKPAQ